MGTYNKLFTRKCNKLLKKYFFHTNFKITFVNPLSIESFFSSKDKLPLEMSSRVVYAFTCPCCLQGTYIVSMVRSLKERFCSHMGISHRTGKILSKKEASVIRNHIIQCKTECSIDNFKIIGHNNNEYSLRILESLLIRTKSPTLNIDNTAVPLLIS